MTGRPTPATTPPWAVVTASSAAASASPLAWTSAVASSARRVVRCGAPARSRAATSVRAGASIPPPPGARRRTIRAGSRQVDAERRRARGQGRQPALVGRGERLLEQRAAHGLLLRAGDLAEAAERGQQRRAGLGRGLHEPVQAPGPAAGEHEPARRRVLPRRDRRRDGVAARDLELGQPRLAPRDGRAQLGHGRAADDDLGLAARADDDHRRVEEACEPLGHHALGLRAAQGVDEVALQRRQPPEDADLVAHQRALDVVDDLAERRLVRNGEEREAALGGGLDQCAGHAAEHDALAEPERGRPRVVELRDELALGRRAAAQAHAGRQHHPLGLEEARRRLDLDHVRAGDRAGRRAVLARQQP